MHKMGSSKNHIGNGVRSKKVSCDGCGKKVFYSELRRVTYSKDMYCENCYYEKP